MADQLNGVNLEGIMAVDKLVRENPALGKCQFKAKSTWQRGTKSQVSISAWTAGGNTMSPAARRYTVTVDEPPELGGGDGAPNPVEVLLSALAGCVTAGIATNAQMFGVPIDAIDIDMEADVDARGMLGHDKSVRNGVTDIRYTVTIQSRPRGEGAEVQGNDRPEVAGARHAREPGEHHVDAGVQVPVTPCRARSTASSRRSSSPSWRERSRPDGVTAILRTAGRSGDYLVADHNWLSLPLANELVRLAMEQMGETDEERWARRYAEYLMEWRPSRADRHYIGTYSMALGEPQRYFERSHIIWGTNFGFLRVELVEIARGRARIQWAPEAEGSVPRWLCTWIKVGLERAPTVWALPPAVVTETACARQGRRPAWSTCDGRTLLSARFSGRRRSRGRSWEARSSCCSRRSRCR